MSIVTLPTPTYRQLISDYRSIAQESGLNWTFNIDSDGKVDKAERWNFTAIANTKGPALYLSDFGTDINTLAQINKQRKLASKPSLDATVLNREWQDLIKALAVRYILVNKRSPGMTFSIVRACRCIATACNNKSPSSINSEDTRETLGILAEVSPKLADNAEIVLRWMNAERISHSHPIVGIRKKSYLQKKGSGSAKTVRKRLNERINNKLPGELEFYELLRIVLDEEPDSFYDEMLMKAALIQALSGLRVGEAAYLPEDTLFKRELVTYQGTNPSTEGGIDHVLYMSHMMEKEGGADVAGLLWRKTQTQVLRIFEDTIQTAVDNILVRTQPLRERLKAQIESGRIFPELDPESTLFVDEVYTRVTGNPIVCKDEYNDAETQQLVSDYKKTSELDLLHRLADNQSRMIKLHGGRARVLSAVLRTFVSRSRETALPWRRHGSGILYEHNTRSDLNEMCVRVADLEDYLRREVPTKLSDIEPFRLVGGTKLEASQLLFLFPKRALIEGRNNSICDVTRYAFVGHFDPYDIQLALNRSESAGGLSLFEKYGKNEETKKYKLESHSFRHLHNNAMFSQGVSDTIITHRFGRKSVAQSYEYDNRTLAQHLSDIDVPEQLLEAENDAFVSAYRLIISGEADGDIVRKFKELQVKSGDESALTFLRENVHQIQLTPYGACTAAFGSENCPKHLTCLDDCSLLTRTSDPKTLESIQKLLKRYENIIAELPPADECTEEQKLYRSTIDKKIIALQKLLSTSVGQPVFFTNAKDLYSVYVPDTEDTE